MFRRTLAGATAAGALLLLASCDHANPSDRATRRRDPTWHPPRALPTTPLPSRAASRGSAGFFIDAQGAPTVYLRDPSQRGRAEQALAPYLRAQGFGAGRLKALKGDYDWAQLEGWFTGASAAALAVRGAVFVDADEASNRVRIGVEPGAGGRVRAALAKLRMPDAAVIVEERAPVTFAVAQGPRPKAKPGSGQSLQGTLRPIIGGAQINFPGFLCTLGFNVNGSFVTNSHCTTTQGGTEGTRYWQPTQTASPSQVATEAADPRTPATSKVVPRAGSVAAATHPGRHTSTDSTSSRSVGSPGPIALVAHSRSWATSESRRKARRSWATW